VLAIALVVVVGVGVFLVVRHKSGVPGSPSATATPTEDWTHGVTQQWQQQFTAGAENWGYNGTMAAMSPDVWVVDDGTAIVGIDPASGQVKWSHDFETRGAAVCTNGLVNGKWPCIVTNLPDQDQQVCLFDGNDGSQQCTSLAGAVSVQDGWSVTWVSIWVADNALILLGYTETTDPDNHTSGTDVARVSMDSLSLAWTKTFAPTCDWSDPASSGEAQDRGDKLGITGNVLWYRGEWQGDVAGTPIAVDIRNGQSLFAADACPVIAPTSDDTFIAANNLPAGPLSLPGGGQINIVHADGATLSYGSGILGSGQTVDPDVTRPTVPVYYETGYNETDQGGVGTLGVLGGPLWQTVMPLQQWYAGAGGEFLNAAVAGNTIVVAGGSGQVKAVDYTTGQVLWSAVVPVQDVGGGLTSLLEVSIVGNLVAVTKTDYENGDQVTLLSLASGQQVGQMSGDAFVSPDGSMLAVVTLTDSNMTVTRYVPTV